MGFTFRARPPGSKRKLHLNNSTIATFATGLSTGFAALFAQSASGKSYKKGSTIPVKIQIRDFMGNVSSPAITVQAAGLTQTSTSANADVLDSGSANPDSDFRFDSGLQGYIFNLSTRDLSTGTWKLSFTVNGQSDPSYSVTFDVR